MKARSLSVAVLVAMPAALLVVTTAGASGSTATSTSATQMIRLIETASKHARVDRPPKGPRLTKGDVWFDSWSLRNAVPQFGRPKGAVVGIEESVITATSDFDAYATSWVRLPGGTLQLVDQFRFAGTTVDTYSVVDGTGVFANVRGTLHSSYLGPGERYLNVYRLRIP